MAQLKHYSAQEEKANIVSHALGLALSLIALPLLLARANLHDNALYTISFGIFGISLIILYTASTFYHAAKPPSLRSRLRIVDHASIYILIAGTYTPFSLVALNGPTGWAIFGASWLMAISGVILKLFFTGKFNRLSTLMYVFMGWIIIFAINPLIDRLSLNGLVWLFSGGLAYTTGAVLYSIKKIKFNHAIFHLFVLIGSICHFISVYFYLLPVE